MKRMSKLKLITDSASDLPDGLLKKYDIEMVPLNINFGHITYKDRVDLSVNEFYHQLKTNPNLPMTSQINPEQFLAVFKKYLDDYSELLVIGLSLKLSGSLQSAKIARDLLKNDRIHIFDSKSASLGEGLYVLKAAKYIAEGLDSTQIINKLTQYQQHAYGLFVLDSLQHLLRTGRLSKPEAAIGSVLNIKPILWFSNSGEILVKEKIRSRKKALSVIIQRFKEQNLDFTQKAVAIGHTDCPDLADSFAETIDKELRPKDIIVNIGGATVGTHVGTGGIGLFC